MHDIVHQLVKAVHVQAHVKAFELISLKGEMCWSKLSCMAHEIERQINGRRTEHS